jgi:hypothetical protein
VVIWSLLPIATFDEAGRLAGQHSPNASSDQSTWGRARAWAMLGLAQAAHSATAIAAAALVKLARLAGEHYRAAAAETLAALGLRGTIATATL